ncbi:MAG: hypothetical protein KA716_29870 [Gloeotrichia echinulata DEX184]|nr:hypothetical protein [Gloeotrichia echinulata DEX184]
MSPPESIKQFSKWLQNFDYRLLKTADDVGTKFILSVFEYLGYPEICHRSQYPLTTYNPGNQTQKFSVAHVYFTTDDFEQQNAETSLMVIETIAPLETNFDAGIKKAKFYSLQLQPLFFLVTNGYNLQVFQFQRYRGEDCLFNLTIDALTNPDIASEFYNKLNFAGIKDINKNSDNLLTVAKYGLIEKYLRRHPDLQEFLVKCDFQPEVTRHGNRLIVVQPKVAIACNLPKAIGEGDCEIEFSSLILKGLKISVNYQNILGNFMLGLNTHPEWKCRPFLQQLDKNAFAAYLGETTIILSETETTDLCLCIDEICREYKNHTIEFENNLETWEFEFINFGGIRGFQLLTIDPKLWELMHKFAQKFDYSQGKSAWHLFHQENISIRVSRGIRDHAFIVPQVDNCFYLLNNHKIKIIYEINDVHLKSLERGKISSWQQDIGLRGTWTARYTKNWLLEQYIPKVIEYYSQQSELFQADLLPEIIKHKFAQTPIQDINDIKDFLPYLRNIQSWLHNYIENIPAALLRAYYQAFTDLVRNTDSAIIGIDYIMGNLRGIAWKNAAEETMKTGTFKNAMNCLDQQVARINNCQVEKSFNADLITRTFIWIIENGKISFSQAQMNGAKQALLPLWEQCRFEMRHVFPYR